MRTLSYGTVRAGDAGEWSALTLRAQEVLSGRMMGHDLVLVAYLMMQVLDGWFTYIGVSIFGIAAEGNPLLALLMEAYEPGVAIIMAKLVAVACGCFLHLMSVDRLLAALTLVYMGAAIVPWALVLF